jgi:hypothetical protein
MKKREREFKAQVVDDFADKWFVAVAAIEKISVDEAKGYYENEEFYRFAERISGKVVTIIENEYSAGGSDCFESIDDNFVMFEGLFKEIQED